MRNALFCFSWCLGVLGVPCLITGCLRPQAVATGCSGPRHLQKETRDCKYDVTYPSVSEPRLERAARQWIDGEMEDFNWYGTRLPFLREKARQMGVPLFLKGAARDRALFKSFALEKGDLALYFDQCTVCPRYAGVVEVSVPLGRIHGILRPAFGGERRRPGP